METDILTPGPELNVGRFYSACNMIKDSITGGYSVITSGGYNQNSMLNSTEILDLNTGAWRMGPSLPLPVFAATMLEHPDGGVVLVGAMKTIFHLPSATGTWTALPQTLKNPVAYSVAFLLAEDSTIANCTTK